jgi:hypothetical protein
VTCDQGYHLAGTTNQPECVADAGCNVNNGGCHPVATCTDTVGGAVCQCPAGYSGNGVGEAGCVDIDECLTNNPCSPNASCTNTEGSFECTCNDGYTGNGLICEPVVPGLVSVSVDPNPLLLGATGTGTVTLDAPVMENTTITLASSNAAELMVDGTTAVPAGQMSGTFAVQRLAGDDGSFATVSATLGDQTVTTEVGFTP